MYIERDISSHLKKVSSMFPAVFLTGPRQSGKTTILKNIFPDAKYVTFDDPVEQSFAKDDPYGFIDRFSGKQVILDEVQYTPELFSYLKMDIDNNRSSYGRWILTGSQQFNMMKDVSDSLAGRIGILNLLPLSINEMMYLPAKDVEDYLWTGSYPEVFLNPEIRDIWLPSYIKTYVERDVRQIINVSDISLFQTFLGLCAANHSQELNVANISRDCGISQPTVSRWISILHTSLIVYLLKPFFHNLGKRLIKSPKLYFIDSGIPAYLTKQGSAGALSEGSMGGAFFEGFIVSETLKIIYNSGVNADLFFWRSHDGMEIDLIIENEGKYHAVEIKKTKTPTAGHAQNLEKFKKLVKEKSGESFVVCKITESRQLTSSVTALPWQEYLKWFNDICFKN